MDYVSAWIVRGHRMIVLGAMFVVLDRTALFNRSDAAGKNGKPFCDYPVNDQAAPARMPRPPSPSMPEAGGMSQLSQRRTAARMSFPWPQRPLMRFSDWNVNIPHRIIVDGNPSPYPATTIKFEAEPLAPE